MKLKEIIKASALQLPINELIGYLDGADVTLSQSESEKLNKLVKLCNLVLSELSSTFMPMVKSESVTVENGKLYYADLSENVTKIIAVTDGDFPVKFKTYSEYLSLSNGSRKVEYEYLPPEYTINQDVGYGKGEISPYVLSYGLNAEYCLTEGRFDDAVVWRKRYVDALELTVRPKNSRVKGRCFV